MKTGSYIGLCKTLIIINVIAVFVKHVILVTRPTPKNWNYIVNSYIVIINAVIQCNSNTIEQTVKTKMIASKVVIYLSRVLYYLRFCSLIFASRFVHYLYLATLPGKKQIKIIHNILKASLYSVLVFLFERYILWSSFQHLMTSPGNWCHYLTGVSASIMIKV